MKKLLAILLAAAMVALCACGATKTEPETQAAPAESGQVTEAADATASTPELDPGYTMPDTDPGMTEGNEALSALTKPLVIMHTNDAHCGVDKNWGYASLYAMKQYFLKSNHVALIDAGDHTQGEPIGTMTSGSSVIKIMNTIGYDLAIPGNHEFDYGMDKFNENVAAAEFPYLSCNFTHEGEQVLKSYIIKEYDGVKIAFVGICTPETLTSTNPKSLKDENGNYIYGFSEDKTGEKLYNTVQAAVDAARAEGAAFVVGVSHLGDEEAVAPYTYADVLANTSGIDVLCDGHSHDTNIVTMKNKEGKPVIRTSTGTKLLNVGVVTFSPDGTIKAENYQWNQKAAAPELLQLENAAAQAVNNELEVLNKELSVVVGKTSFDMVINDPEKTMEDGSPIRIVRNNETNLGDFLSDAYLNAAGGEADAAILNGGGIRDKIPAGDITLNTLLKVFPFQNELSVMELSGQAILDALEWGVHGQPSEFGGFLHVSNITFTVDLTVESPAISDDSSTLVG
ncbi:MAG: bifunctional metallophosphatase/5'-nucleotidase, partial [Parasporobacterium sp.]|nr:bifunctional metallophosphatase/5'-nucleotidase [Parasporobacterium sp.]